jgi:Holliday junction resolvase RusA-like endonuclease
MIHIDVKPLSANLMYNGRKVKSYKYRNYEKTLLPLLPNELEVPEGKIHLVVKVGMSSKLSDLDNVLKPFIDCLQLKYSFNDKWIYKLTATKKDVPKVKEYIKFELRGIK